MRQVYLLLQKNPGMGGSAGILLTAQSFMKTTAPYLQYAGLVMGTLMVAVSLCLKIREWVRGK